MMVMTKKKIFKDNESYFEFINKMKEKINILSFKITKTTIRIEYEVIKNEASRNYSSR